MRKVIVLLTLTTLICPIFAQSQDVALLDLTGWFFSIFDSFVGTETTTASCPDYCTTQQLCALSACQACSICNGGSDDPGSCTPNCPSPSEVACGTNYTDDDGCGIPCEVIGTKCDSGTCINGQCQGSTPNSTCVDSDAMDYYNKGTVTKGTESKEDECIDTNYLKEFYCFNNQIVYTNKICGNGCENGACKSSAPPSESCPSFCTSKSYCSLSYCSECDMCKESPDNPDNPPSTQTCSDGTLVGSCSATKPSYCNASKVLVDNCTFCHCPSGKVCNSTTEKCDTTVNPSDKCSDSDGGLDYLTQGVTTDQFGTSTDKCVGSYLMEYYCSGDVKKYQITACTGSCQNGACVGGGGCIDDCSPSGTKQCSGTTGYKTCGNHDSDSCLDWGPVTICIGGKICQNGNCIDPSTTDKCSDGTLVGSCSATKPSYCNASKVLVDNCTFCHCPSGKVCNSTTEKCDTANPPSPGNCPSFCTSKSYCSFSYCSECDMCKESPDNPDKPPSTTCSDSDGGINEFVKGLLTNSYGTYTDTCFGSTYLKEYYCSNDFAFSKLISCSGGCKDGICLEGDSPCHDTDGGKDISVKGTVTWLNLELTDRCVGDKYIIEYYCASGMSKTHIEDCNGSCQNGACVGGGGCIDDCSPSGTKQCSGTTGYKTCGNHDSDSCLDWGPVTPCPTGQTCSSGQCSSPTPTTCTPGTKKQGTDCSVCNSTGNGYDDNSSLCPIGKTCQNGICTGGPTTCIDSDGLNYWEVGTVSSSGGTLVDECDLTDTQKKTLIEYFCNQTGFPDNKTYACSNGCLVGACKEE